MPQPYSNTFSIDYLRGIKTNECPALALEQQQITNVANVNLSVLPSELPKQYQSSVASSEGHWGAESSLPGARSYVNVTYNDGGVTQDFVKTCIFR